ncbi:MAG: hypothetical protein AAGF02_20020 [Actinomycetota bacterium]
MTLRRLAVLVTSLLLLAACGGDADEAEPPATSGPPATSTEPPPSTVPAPAPDPDAESTATATNDGEVVRIELTHTGAPAEARGVCWIIERWDTATGDWVGPRHVGTQADDVGEPVEPVPLTDDFACITLAVTGPGPDLVRLPVDAVEPGVHRLCEGFEPAGSVCAVVEVPAPTAG